MDGDEGRGSTRPTPPAPVAAELSVGGLLDTAFEPSRTAEGKRDLAAVVCGVGVLGPAHNRYYARNDPRFEYFASYPTRIRDISLVSLYFAYTTSVPALKLRSVPRSLPTSKPQGDALELSHHPCGTSGRRYNAP